MSAEVPTEQQDEMIVAPLAAPWDLEELTRTEERKEPKC
jgi:hypothetical protein